MPILFMQILAQTCTVGWITFRNVVEIWRIQANREAGHRSVCDRVADLSTPGTPQQIDCRRVWKESDAARPRSASVGSDE